MKRVLLVSLGLIAVARYIGCLPEDAGTPRAAGGSTGTPAAERRVRRARPARRGRRGTTGDAGACRRRPGRPAARAAIGSDGRHDGATAGTGGSGATAGTGGTARRPARAAAAPAWRHGRLDGGAAGGTRRTRRRGRRRHRRRGGTTGGATWRQRHGRGGTTGTGGAAGPITIPELFPTSGHDRLARRAAGRHAVRRRQRDRHRLRRRRRILLDRRLDARPRASPARARRFNVNQVFYVGGETGQMYNVTVHFYGIAEPKNYGTGVTREAGTGPTGRPRTTGARRRRRRRGRRPPAATRTRSRTTTPTRSAFAGPAPARPTDETTVYYLNADTQRGPLDVRHQLQEADHRSSAAARCACETTTATAARSRTAVRPNTAANQCATDGERARSSTSPPRCRQPSTDAASSGGLLQPNLDPARAGGRFGTVVAHRRRQDQSVQ